MLSEEKRHCSCCFKTRVCVPENPNAKSNWDTDWYCKMECLNATPDERAQIRERVVDEQIARPRQSRFAYPCIGGPLDNSYVTTADFAGQPHKWAHGQRVNVGSPGRYHHLKNDYFEFNSGFRSAKRVGGHPSMIYVHRSLIKPLISPKDR